MRSGGPALGLTPPDAFQRAAPKPQPFRLETALLCSVDHCPDLSLANGAGCLNVNNDAELQVDEVVVGVSKKMRSLVRSDPLCRGIGWTTSLATPHGLLVR